MKKIREDGYEEDRYDGETNFMISSVLPLAQR